MMLIYLNRKSRSFVVQFDDERAPAGLGAPGPPLLYIYDNNLD